MTLPLVGPLLDIKFFFNNSYSHKNKSNLNYYMVQFYDVIYKEIRF